MKCRIAQIRFTFMSSVCGVPYPFNRILRRCPLAEGLYCIYNYVLVYLFICLLADLPDFARD
jgi:hypothetical protein